MTPEQVKAARVLLGWSIERLAAYSGMSIHAVRMFEQTGTVVPMRGRNWKARIDAAAALHATLEKAGIKFTEGDMPGVRLRKPLERTGSI